MKSWPNIGGALADYVDANWLRESPLKRRLREETGKMRQAGMQISAHQGQQMALLARAIGARRAVEVGTFTGYSALCVAEALPAGRQALVLRRQRGMDAHRPALLEGSGTRQAASSSPSARRSSTLDWPAAPRDSPASSTSPSSTPTRTDYDAYYERCLKLLRPRRAGADRQRAVGRLGRQPGRERCRHPGDPSAQRQAQAATSASTSPLFAVGDGMTWR